MQTARMLWQRQAEADEAAMGPGAPPCGSSGSSQCAEITTESNVWPGVPA